MFKVRLAIAVVKLIGILHGCKCEYNHRYIQWRKNMFSWGGGGGGADNIMVYNGRHCEVTKHDLERCGGMLPQ